MSSHPKRHLTPIVKFNISEFQDPKPLFPFLVNKTNSRTELQIYWYYDSTCFGQPFRPSSGVLSRTSALVHFMQLWWPFATRNNKRSSKLHKMYRSRYKSKNSWWWAERLPETCTVVIPIKLEFSAPVGFIHKEFVTMQDHTILKFCFHFCKSWFTALNQRSLSHVGAPSFGGQPTRNAALDSVPAVNKEVSGPGAIEGLWRHYSYAQETVKARVVSHMRIAPYEVHLGVFWSDDEDRLTVGILRAVSTLRRRQGRRFPWI